MPPFSFRAADAVPFSAIRYKEIRVRSATDRADTAAADPCLIFFFLSANLYHDQCGNIQKIAQQTKALTQISNLPLSYK
jgi:hypothetical protein